MLFENNYDPDLCLAVLNGYYKLTVKRLENLLQVYSNNMVEAVQDNLNKLIDKKWVNSLNFNVFEQYYYDLQTKLDENDIKLITVIGADYPNQLKDIIDYPITLYYQGNSNLLKISNKKMITVVGSRVVHHYTKSVLNKIIQPICQSGVGIVSGLAIGVDSLAHKIALENNALTIGVTGSGLDDDSFYPNQNLSLKQQILNTGGLLLSEYMPGSKPTKFSFPQRNRILGALTEVTLVAQASNKSGSLITANLAQDMGKTVATIPQSIFDTNFSGNLELLKNGANLVTESEDIFTLLGISTNFIKTNPKNIQFDSLDEQKIFNILSFEPMNFNELIIKSGLKQTNLVTVLSVLELKGLARDVGENNWVRG